MTGAYVFAMLLGAAASVWVGIDASRRDWQGNEFADRPWKWVVGSLFLSSVVFPIYLFQRKVVTRLP